MNRSGNLEQRGSLDRLHVSPEMTIVISEIAEPAAAGPGFDDHGQRLPVGRFVAGPHLLQQRVEGGVHGGTHVNLLRHIQGEVLALSNVVPRRCSR
jgi:hypothetical protein